MGLLYHALLLISDGHSFDQVATPLYVDAESVSCWVGYYMEKRLDGVKNNPRLVWLPPRAAY